MLSLAIYFKVQQTSLIFVKPPPKKKQNHVTQNWFLWSKKKNKKNMLHNQRNQSKKRNFKNSTHLVLSEGDISFIWKSPICIVELSLIFTLGISGTRRPTYKNQKIKKIRYTECFTINMTIWRRPYSKLLWEAMLNAWSRYPMWARLNLGYPMWARLNWG